MQMVMGSQNFCSKFLPLAALIFVVQTQAQSDFLSIDCGLPANTSSADNITGLSYVSDASFINTGKSMPIATRYSTNLIPKQLHNVRSFPEGGRNCYNVSLIGINKYLIRATFMYGDYDGLDKPPAFNIYLGPNSWRRVKISKATSVETKEIIHTPKLNYVHVCLVDTGAGTPFISTLEFRPLEPTSYVTAESGSSLVNLFRWDFGSSTNQIIRYPDDAYDRLWTPSHGSTLTDISTDKTIPNNDNIFQPPSIVMRTASTAASNEPLEITINTDFPLQFYVYMYFSEILQNNQSRHFNISFNAKYLDGPFTPQYLVPTTYYSKSALMGGKIINVFSLYQTGGSTLAPLLNAFELYYVMYNSNLETDQDDVDAIVTIKSTYGIRRNWQGDPCSPEAYTWEGLACNYTNGFPPAIISLDLSSSGLMGQIAREVANLKSLESLDLSNNSLTGPVPDFLSQLSSLKTLKLTGNNLSGTIPTELFERSQNGSLSLGVGENPHLCPFKSCNNKRIKKKVLMSVVIVVAVLLGLAAASAFILWNLKRKRQQAEKMESGKRSAQLGPINRQLTHAEILEITDNFQRELGKGAFGTVYHGYLDGIQVAVKMLSPSSTQGYKEFQTEVNLLLRVHHKNLTTLVGYCNEGTNLGLIYEYMAMGNLEDHLSDSSKSDVLSWRGRVQIALDAAQGLEYLHNGCKPQIIHRDIKPTNILLSEKYEAKLADFGLSRAFPTNGGTHVSTVAAGTPGYLDPEYYRTNQLTEKSDVYSFGVVLLRIITGQPAVIEIPEITHINQWVDSLLKNGDIQRIVDPRLQGDFDASSAWKSLELAMACVNSAPAQRPTMTEVVTELNDCMATAVARTNVRSQGPVESINAVLVGLSPQTR